MTLFRSYNDSCQTTGFPAVYASPVFSIPQAQANSLGALFLKELLYAVENIFSMSDTTSAASKKSDAKGKAMGVLFGSGKSTNRKTDSVVPTNEADFQSTYSGLINAAANSVSQALAAARG